MPIIAKLHVELPWDEGTKHCSNVPGNMTKMDTTPIYGKNIFFSETESLTTLKLDKQLQILKYHQVFSNDDPGLTLTYL